MALSIRLLCRAHWLNLVWLNSLQSKPQVAGPTILSGAIHYTLRKKPNSADDIWLFLLDIVTLCSVPTQSTYWSDSVKYEYSISLLILFTFTIVCINSNAYIWIYWQAKKRRLQHWKFRETVPLFTWYLTLSRTMSGRGGKSGTFSWVRAKLNIQ